MQIVELVIGRVFIYRGQIFEKGKLYQVSPTVARELLGKHTMQGVPHFRLALEPEDEEVSTPEDVEGDAEQLPLFKEDDIKEVANQIEKEEEELKTAPPPPPKKRVVRKVSPKRKVEV